MRVLFYCYMLGLLVSIGGYLSALAGTLTYAALSQGYDVLSYALILSFFPVAWLLVAERARAAGKPRRACPRARSTPTSWLVFVTVALFSLFNLYMAVWGGWEPQVIRRWDGGSHYVYLDISGGSELASDKASYDARGLNRFKFRYSGKVTIYGMMVFALWQRRRVQRADASESA